MLQFEAPFVVAICLNVLRSPACIVMWLAVRVAELSRWRTTRHGVALLRGRDLRAPESQVIAFGRATTRVAGSNCDMGVCLSCCQESSGAEDDGYRNRQTERTPLLQDPTAVLQQPRPEPTPEDQQRDQEALARIVDRTAENLINIQSTFDRRKNHNDMDATEKTAHFKYLIEKLQNNTLRRKESSASVPADSEPQKTIGAAAKDTESFTFSMAPTPMTPAEERLLTRTSDLLREAINSVKRIEDVGDVVVKLSWD